MPDTDGRAVRRRKDMPHDVYLGIAGVALVAPAVFFLILVVGGPFAYVVWQSLFGQGPHRPGFGNFQWFLANGFWSTLENGLIITAGSVFIEIAVALPL